RPQPRLRHRAAGRRHLAPPCRGARVVAGLDDRRPGLYQRRAAQRPPGARRAAAGARRPPGPRLHRDRLRSAMSSLAPVSVALKFGFLAVLFLFVLWVARSARRDLRGGSARERELASTQPPPDATGFHAASTVGPIDFARRAPRLVVERAPGHDPG